MSTNAPLSAELSDAYPIMIFGPKEVEVESGTSGLERLMRGTLIAYRGKFFLLSGTPYPKGAIYDTRVSQK